MYVFEQIGHWAMQIEKSLQLSFSVDWHACGGGHQFYLK